MTLRRGSKPLTETHPELCKEWSPSNDCSPSEVSKGSEKFKPIWVCSLGHEWESFVHNRLKGKGCPYCANKKVLPGYNDLVATNPELASQWHPTKNTLSPTEVTLSSGKKVWWICGLGHEYESTVYNRNNGRKCPYCLGRKVLQGYNDLVSQNPSLAREWHPTKNTLKPTEVTSGSNKKVWWICSEGHEWDSKVGVRNCNETKCPYCCNQKVLQGFNDLATTHPDLASEWHSIKNEMKPTEVPYGTGKKVWWICSEGHAWKTSVVVRSQGYGCPHCNKNSGSEYRMVRILEDNFGGHLGQSLDFKFGNYTCRVDYVNADGLIVEYDGNWWHESKEDVDTRKTELLLSKGHTVVRLRQTPLTMLPIKDDNLHQYSVKWDRDGSNIRNIILDLKSTLLGAQG